MPNSDDENQDQGLDPAGGSMAPIPGGLSGGGGVGETTTHSNNNKKGSGAPIPKCVCSWKNCRVYQRFFRDHPVWDGVIKLKFVSTEPAAMALKASIDRNLKVPDAKAHDWKPAKSGVEITKYYVACHHWTEQHIRKYRADPKHYSFTKPFTVHGATKYLFKVDKKEVFRDPAGSDSDELLYLQSPLVPKETVKSLFYQIKEEGEKGSKRSEHKTRSRTKLLRDDDLVNSSHNNNFNDECGASSTNWKSSGLDEKDQGDSLTVSTSRSSKTAEVLLIEKESENKRLKDQLEAMQSQISFLHNMVSTLQMQHYDTQKIGRPRTSGSSGHRRQNKDGNGSSRPTTGRSSSVPDEIAIDSEDDGEWIEPQLYGEWSDDEEDDDERSQGTFHINYYQPGELKRNGSFNSKTSQRSRATSIVSAAKSVKSLPREIELEEDEDSHESLEEEAFENKSFASSKKHGGKHSKHASRSRGPAASSRLHSKEDDSTISGFHQVTALVVTDPYGEGGTYTGSISNTSGMPHGFGRLEYDKAGRWYEGDWRHGRWTGKGRLSNGDGDFYEGGLRKDHKHGFGIMKFADGRIFEGEYVNGQMVDGKMTYQDGSTYTGGWMDGMRHGRGRCVFTDESVYEGEFREGEFFGYGKMSWSDGGWYEGEWVNGEMQGLGKEIRPDGTLRHEGQWLKGQPIRK